MDREETKKMIEVMNAYVNGRSIQCREFGTEKWLGIDTPNWYLNRFEYRIKPDVEHKYAVGDYVLVLDGSKIDDYTYGFVDEMYNLVGRIYQIESLHTKDGRHCYHLQGDEDDYFFDERGLAPVKIGE